MSLGLPKASRRYDAAQRACRDGNLEAVKWLFENASIFENAPALRKACISGAWGTGNSGLADEVYSTSDSIRLHEMLQIATTRGHTDLVKFLLERFPAKRLHVVEWEIIVNAIGQGDVALLQPFVEVDPDLVNLYNPRFGTCFSALFSLVTDHDTQMELVSYLLDHGADPNLRGNQTLQEAVESSSPAVVALLVSRGAIGDPLTMLHNACRSGNELMVKNLLDSGASVDQIDSIDHEGAGEGQSVLQLSAAKGHQGIFRLLQEHGARLKES